MNEMDARKQGHLLDLLVSGLQEYVVLLLDPEGQIMSWHPAVERQFGYTAEELIGQNGEILFPLPDRMKGAFRRELQKAAETGRASDTNWLVTKTGRPVFVEGVSLALREPESGELLGFGKVLNDVTDEKQTDNDRKTLTRAIDQASIYILNWDGIIEYWTAGCERIYGWGGQEAIGRSCDELLQTTFPESMETIRRGLLKNGVWEGDLQQRRKDGSLVCVSAYWTLFSEGSEDSPDIIATHVDITARLAAQRELETANQRLQALTGELERSNGELEEFARIASHDLSAPITSTRWLAELLTARQGNLLDADGRKMLNQITAGLQRMTDLVEAILSHARVGTEPIGATQPTSAEQALDIALANLERHVNHSGATVSRSRLPELYIEPQPLARLFQNLISNAIKYRREDVRPEVSIEARRSGELWLLSVRDNGMGIEPDWFQRIFLPMQRLHNPKISGSGIGLATCHKIVRRAGGKIWVESQLGIGSTFFFTLPGPANT